YVSCLRQPGQGGDADEPRDLRAELPAAEAAHYAKKQGIPQDKESVPPAIESSAPKRQLEGAPSEPGGETEDYEAKRRRILEETRHIDAESDDDEESDS